MSTTIEIAVYTVDDIDTATNQQTDVHAVLSTFDGYQQSVPLRAVEQMVLVDVVVWANDEAAQNAASQVQHDPRTKGFLASIKEMIAFEHFEGPEQQKAKEALAEISSAPFIELVLLSPIEIDDFRPAHASLASRHLPANDDVISHLPLKSNSNAVAGDFIGWTSAEAHQKAPEALASLDDVAAVFNPENTIVTMQSLTLSEAN